MGVIKEAVINWIKCEYAFRSGPYAYTQRTQEYFNDAENKLREVVTGTIDPAEAAKAVGIEVPDFRFTQPRAVIVDDDIPPPRPDAYKIPKTRR